MKWSNSFKERIWLRKYIEVKIAKKTRVSRFKSYGYSQKLLLEKFPWDILIVLDACRFDIFNQYYKQYFDGKLLKVISSGTHTTEWFKNTFTSYYPNCYYISANPFISSRNVLELDYEPSNYFEKVIDCWDYLWDDYLGTVLPWDLTREALSIILRSPHKRYIIHYIQPHSPYIALLGYEKYLYPDVIPSRQGILNRSGRPVSSKLNLLGGILRYIKWSLPLLVGHKKNCQD